MCAYPRRHFRGWFEQLRKRMPIGRDDRVVIVEYVIVDRPGISIDRYLDAVANVIYLLAIVVKCLEYG